MCILCLTVSQLSSLCSSFLDFSWILQPTINLATLFWSIWRKSKEFRFRAEPQTVQQWLSFDSISASAIDLKAVFGMYLLNLYNRPSAFEQSFKRPSQWGFQLNASSICTPRSLTHEYWVMLLFFILRFIIHCTCPNRELSRKPIQASKRRLSDRLCCF
jgi:hypothetical protein